MYELHPIFSSDDKKLEFFETVWSNLIKKLIGSRWRQM